MKDNKPTEANYKMMATKVSIDAADRLDALCQKKGINAYTMMQMVCDTLIRYMDDRHNLSAEIKQIIDTFEGLEGWTDQFNIADPSTRKQVSDAIYFLTAEGKTGCRAVEVGQPFFDFGRDCTFSIQEIIEMTLCRLSPNVYRKLRKVGVEMDCNSALETIMKLCDELPEDENDIELRKLFEDNNRSEYGTAPSEPTRRKPHIAIDSPLLFTKNEQ